MFKGSDQDIPAPLLPHAAAGTGATDGELPKVFGVTEAAGEETATTESTNEDVLTSSASSSSTVTSILLALSGFHTRAAALLPSRDRSKEVASLLWRLNRPRLGILARVAVSGMMRHCTRVGSRTAFELCFVATICPFVLSIVARQITKHRQQVLMYARKGHMILTRTGVLSSVTSSPKTSDARRVQFADDDDGGNDRNDANNSTQPQDQAAVTTKVDHALRSILAIGDGDDDDSGEENGDGVEIHRKTKKKHRHRKKRRGGNKNTELFGRRVISSLFPLYSSRRQICAYYIQSVFPRRLGRYILGELFLTAVDIGGAAACMVALPVVIKISTLVDRMTRSWSSYGYGGTAGGDQTPIQQQKQLETESNDILTASRTEDSTVFVDAITKTDTNEMIPLGPRTEEVVVDTAEDGGGVPEFKTVSELLVTERFSRTAAATMELAEMTEANLSPNIPWGRLPSWMTSIALRYYSFDGGDWGNLLFGGAYSRRSGERCKKVISFAQLRDVCGMWETAILLQSPLFTLPIPGLNWIRRFLQQDVLTPLFACCVLFVPVERLRQMQRVLPLMATAATARDVVALHFASELDAVITLSVSGALMGLSSSPPLACSSRKKKERDRLSKTENEKKCNRTGKKSQQRQWLSTRWMRVPTLMPNALITSVKAKYQTISPFLRRFRENFAYNFNSCVGRVACSAVAIHLIPFWSPMTRAYIGIFIMKVLYCAGQNMAYDDGTAQSQPDRAQADTKPASNANRRRRRRM